MFGITCYHVTFLGLLMHVKDCLVDHIALSYAWSWFPAFLRKKNPGLILFPAVMNTTNSSSGVSSVPTSTVKPSHIDIQMKEESISMCTGKART